MPRSANKTIQTLLMKRPGSCNLVSSDRLSSIFLPVLLCRVRLPVGSPVALHRLPAFDGAARPPSPRCRDAERQRCREGRPPLFFSQSSICSPAYRPELSHLTHSLSELDLKGLVQLSGEGVRRGGRGALARAALQGGPLGLEGIFQRRRGRLGERGGRSQSGRSGPVVRPVEGRAAVGRLEGGGGGGPPARWTAAGV